MDRRWAVSLAILVVSAGHWAGCSPSRPPDAVIHGLPDLAGRLAHAKALCESRAQRVKSEPAVRPRKRADIASGEKLYGDARAELDGCIAFLRLGLETRFEGISVASAETRVQRATAKMTNFIHWADGRGRADRRPARDDGSVTFGAGPGYVIDVLELVGQWVMFVRTEDAARIEQIRADLLQYRLRPWAEL